MDKTMLMADKSLIGSTQPDGWTWSTMAEVCIKVQDGTHFSPKTQYNETRPGRYLYITAKNVRYGRLDLADVSYIDEGVHTEIYRRCNPEYGDVLLTKDGVNTGVAAVSELDEPYSLLSSVALLKPLHNVLASRYLMYYLNSPVGRQEITGQMTGTAIKRIILKRIKSARIILAPIDEQRRIVDAIEAHFTRLDAVVAALKRSQANLRRYRASVLKAACEGRLVPTEAALAQAEGREYEPADVLLARILAERRRKWVEAEAERLHSQNRFGNYDDIDHTYEGFVPLESSNLPHLPEGWVWCSLDSLTYFTVDYRGKTPPRADNGVQVISAGNVKQGNLDFEKPRFISWETYKQVLTRGIPVPGDLIVTTEAPVGNAALFPDGQTYHLTRRVIGFQTSRVNNVYLMYCFESKTTRAHLQRHSRGTTVPRILKPRLLATPIPLPPLAEQLRIVAEVERRLSVIDALEATVEANLARAERLRQSILKRAFQGKLVPQDPDDEPASVLLERVRPGQKDTARSAPKQEEIPFGQG